ncbi:MAG: class I SAM-dependent RNA methyltransferase [Treponema sp.]|nr:class I SAM-dependent RNA methyltransferase [Treponema sp.]
MATTQIITAEKMVFGGDCIGKIEGKNVFVPAAVPGEKLEVEITREQRDYSTARIVRVLEPSVHRVLPFCPLYGRCGGCNMQHIDAAYQQELRAAILREAFEREGLTVPEIVCVAGSPTGYRTRFQFHSGGLMERQSNNIIQLSACPCASAEINKYLAEVPPAERPEGRVHVFGSSRISSIPEGYDKIVIAEEQRRQAPRQEKQRPASTPGGRRLPKMKRIKPRFEGTTAIPANLCTISLAGKSVTFDVQGFFQSNLDVLEQAVPLVCEGLHGTNVLDMYAGAGTFSVFLADCFKNICMVEHNRDALVYAEQNLAGTVHESFGLSGETWTKYHAESYLKRHGGFDAVVIDPPRSGMEKAVCQWLCQSQIPAIRSLSCDPATHARDAKFLVRAGYRLQKLFLLDFYPQTCHIESLAWFSR